MHWSPFFLFLHDWRSNDNATPSLNEEREVSSCYAGAAARQSRSYKDRAGDRTGEAFGLLVHWSNSIEQVEPLVQKFRTGELNRP